MTRIASEQYTLALMEAGSGEQIWSENGDRREQEGRTTNQARIRQRGRDYGTCKRPRSTFSGADQGALHLEHWPVSGQRIAQREDASLIQRKLPLGFQ